MSKKIDNQTIQQLAALARLEIEPSQVPELKSQLAKILDYVDKIQSLKTDKVMPWSETRELTSPWRLDQAKPFSATESLIDIDKLDKGLLKTKPVFDNED